MGSSSDLAVMVPSSASSDTAGNGDNPRQERANPLRRPFCCLLGSGGCCERFRDLGLAVLAHFDQYTPKAAKYERVAAGE